MLFYKSEFLDLLAKFSIVNDQIVISSEGGFVIVRHGTALRNPLIYIRGPKDCFAIEDGTKVAFHDYSRFYNKFRALSYPELDLRRGEIVISADGRTATHNLADPNNITDPFNGKKTVGLPSVEASFLIDEGFTRKLCSMAGANLFDANRVRFTFEKGKSQYMLWSTQNADRRRGVYANTYTEPMQVNNFYSDEKFQMDFDMALFLMLPLGHSYQVAVSKAGALELEMFGTNGIACTIYLTRCV